jgi:3-mercaptopyruvate sulfurtransferase SseA
MKPLADRQWLEAHLHDPGVRVIEVDVSPAAYNDWHIDGAGDPVTYCTIGGCAATAWFVLTYLLGRDQVRVYDGSWAEWGRTPAAPSSAREDQGW